MHRLSIRHFLAGCKALGDETRLRIIRVLQLFGPFEVNELAQVLRVSQPRTSRHLRVLTDCAFITPTRKGVRVAYSLLPGPVATSPEHPGLLDVLAASAPDPAFFPHDLGRARTCLEERERRLATEREEIGPRWYQVRDRYLGKLDEVTVIQRMLGEAETIVDLGSGDGRLLCGLPQGRHYIGIDRAEAMIKAARKRADKGGRADIQFRLGDLEHLPLPDHSADLVVASMVLHHLDDVRPVLAEVARVLRRGGRMIILDFDQHHDSALAKKCHDRVCGFPRAGLTQSCREVGLALDDWQVVSGATKIPVFLATVKHAAGRPKSKQEDPWVPKWNENA